MKDRQTQQQRRALLKAFGLGAGSLALASGGARAALTPSPIPTAQPDTRFRVTAHVQSYYQTLKD
ncbi:formate dehydrogenase [Ferrimonas sediminicola]|uniref:Formate dehydrogenase n=1 Tax=Ferrimonas sediminicola TaxID=2569538 RepID=A0A4V6WMQ5_9GAMM|nr:formate dehydrogenase [Ferrimonas sediminicola]TKB51001.1 formate dehydrogenase [Ferrimonas sediminicola]